MEKITPSTQSDASYELFTPLDIYHRQVYQELFKKVPRTSALSWMRAIDGRWSKRETQRHLYSFYEEGQFMAASATIAAASSNGAKMDVTLSTEDHQSLGGGTNNTSFVVKNQLVLFEDGVTQGFVESIDRGTPGAHVVTIKKTSSSMDIASASQVGSTIVFYSNAQPERSTRTESRVPRFNKISNKIHTLREGFAVTDHEMQNALEFKYKGKDRTWYKGIDETAERFDLQRELACLIAPDSDGLNDGAGNGVQTMFGLIPQIRQHGQTFEYYGTPDQTSFEEIILGLDNEYGDKDYLVGVGLNLENGLNRWLVEFAKAGTGNVDFSAFGGEKQALSIGLKSVSMSSWSFHFQRWDIFSHKDTLGAKGLPFRHMGVFIPTGMGKNPKPGNSTSGSNNFGGRYEPYIQVVYSDPQCAAAEHHGDHQVAELGMKSRKGATSDEAARYIEILGYYGLEMRCRNKFAIWEAA